MEFGGKIGRDFFFTVFFEPPNVCAGDPLAVVFYIAEDSAVTQYYTVLDGLLMAEFDTAAELAQFLLYNAR